MHVWVDAGKGLEARDFSTFTFSHWANKLRFLIERHYKLKSEIKNTNFLTLHLSHLQHRTSVVVIVQVVLAVQLGQPFSLLRGPLQLHVGQLRGPPLHRPTNLLTLPLLHSEYGVGFKEDM